MALGAIREAKNRFVHEQRSEESFDYAQDRSDHETLRGVYPERSRRAQGDKKWFC